MKCKNCTHVLEPGHKFCGNCSEMVDKDEHNANIKRCPDTSCNTMLKSTASFCTECGKGIDKDTGSTDVGEAAGDEVDGKRPQVQPEVYNPKDKDNNFKTKAEGAKVQKARRGFAVISTHNDFNKNPLNLSNRQCAFDDAHHLKDVLEQYGCKCLDLRDKDNNYYSTKLVDEINNEKGGEDYDYFIFALSSHGDEKEEAETNKKEGEVKKDDEKKVVKKDDEKKVIKKDDEKKEVKNGDEKKEVKDGDEKEEVTKRKKVYNHYFYTKNGSYQTQQLIEDIVEKVTGIKDKLKIFIIQACRSRVNDTRTQNTDVGATIQINNQHVETGTTIHSSPKSVDSEDSKGSMPNEKEGEETKSSSSTKTVELKAKTTPEIEIEDISPEAAIPHCDDGIVVFASMSGKTAYRRDNSNDQKDPSGGWLITTFCDVLKSRSSDDKVDILDVLTDVNKTVSQRDASLPLESAKDLEIYSEILLKVLSSEQSEDQHSKYKIQIEEIMRSLKTIEHKDAKDSITTVGKAIGFTGLKSQCCFFHNLTFNSEDLCLKFRENS